MEAAAILDAHFARPESRPDELAWAFHEVDAPIGRNDHIAAALRADRERVQETGRWLVRHSPDRCSALIGLALPAMDRADKNADLIRHIGLLSNDFGPLAALALQRCSGVDNLIWLAERTAGRGRVYLVEALCQTGGIRSRPWPLRHACDGDFLNGYFAGQVAVTAHLREAITAPDADEQVIDHTGRLLNVMSFCSGTGMTWQHYPPIRAVLKAHAGHLPHQTTACAAVSAGPPSHRGGPGDRATAALGGCDAGVSHLHRPSIDACELPQHRSPIPVHPNNSRRRGPA